MYLGDIMGRRFAKTEEIEIEIILNNVINNPKITDSLKYVGVGGIGDPDNGCLKTRAVYSPRPDLR